MFIRLPYLSVKTASRQSRFTRCTLVKMFLAPTWVVCFLSQFGFFVLKDLAVDWLSVDKVLGYNRKFREWS